MRQKRLPHGTMVEIIGVEHSSPITAMFKLIGKKSRITDNGDGQYKVLGWWWDPKDFKVLDDIPSTEFLFDAKDLVIGDNL